MKLSTLLTQRQTLLRRARLANLAFAHQTLARFSALIARAQLRGIVALKSPAPELEHYGAALTALTGSQAVLEEHFTDENVTELADVVAFVLGKAAADETFHLEDVAETFLAPVRAELEREGVALDDDTRQPIAGL